MNVFKFIMMRFPDAEMRGGRKYCLRSTYAIKNRDKFCGFAVLLLNGRFNVASR